VLERAVCLNPGVAWGDCKYLGALYLHMLGLVAIADDARRVFPSRIHLVCAGAWSRPCSVLSGSLSSMLLHLSALRGSYPLRFPCSRPLADSLVSFMPCSTTSHALMVYNCKCPFHRVFQDTVISALSRRPSFYLVCFGRWACADRRHVIVSTQCSALSGVAAEELPSSPLIKRTRSLASPQGHCGVKSSQIRSTQPTIGICV
jgi:hypothetical protein